MLNEKKLLESKLEKLEYQVKRIGEDIVDEQKRIITDIFKSQFDDDVLGVVGFEERIRTLAGKNKDDLRRASNPDEVAKYMKINELYENSQKTINANVVKKNEINGRDRAGYMLSSSVSSSSNSIPSVTSEIKKKEDYIRKFEEQIREIGQKISREKNKLDDYVLRIYVYEMKGVKLVSKYMSNGKKNQQFELLEKKGYDAAVKGSVEYQKNADKMIKDAPMFSQASCLQKKLDIQTMFDNIILTVKDKIKDTLDSDMDMKPETEVNTETKPEPKLGGAGETEVERIKENLSNFSLLSFVLDPPQGNKTGVQFTPKTKRNQEVECTAQIKKPANDEEKKQYESRDKLKRMAKITLGKYPSFFIPQGHFKMHDVLYQPVTESRVEMDCVEPPTGKKEIVIKNLERLMDSLKIPFTFPILSRTDDEKKKYEDSIQQPMKFGPMDGIIGGR